MDKKIFWITGIIMVVIGGTVAYLLAGPDTDKAKQDMAGQRQERPSGEAGPGPVDTGSTDTKGAYISYKEGLIQSTKGTKLLFFHAPWCPQCRALEADIKAKGVPDGVTIFEVDYDTNQALRQKYGVTLQTTIVRVDDNGDLVEKFVAYDDPSLAAVAENVLQ